jgi:hypothetical protein
MMAKFIKLDIVDTNHNVYINVDDISYIEGNTVRMKSLGERSGIQTVEKKSLREVYKTNYYLVQEHFDITDASLNLLLSALDFL